MGLRWSRVFYPYDGAPQLMGFFTQISFELKWVKKGFGLGGIGFDLEWVRMALGGCGVERGFTWEIVLGGVDEWDVLGGFRWGGGNFGVKGGLCELRHCGDVLVGALRDSRGTTSGTCVAGYGAIIALCRSCCCSIFAHSNRIAPYLAFPKGYVWFKGSQCWL